MARPSRPPPTPEARLAMLGLRAADEPTLRALGCWPPEAGEDGDEDGEAGWALIEALASGADSRRSLAAFARIGERAPDTWDALVRHARTKVKDPLAPIRRTALLAGASDVLAELLARDPGQLAVVTGELRAHDAATVRAAAAAALDYTPEPARALARAQRRILARIAVRDLAGQADMDATATELSDLAEGVLAAALDHIRASRGTSARLAVIAMGKLGGRELNYVSDVDLLFVGDGDPAATRLAEAFLQLAGGVSPEGRAYEIDTTLRPEGRDGPLVRTIDGYRAYYERWAATWEFQALLKARWIAGDPDLGEAFAALVPPFVWPDRRSAGHIDEIQRLKGVAEGSDRVRRARAGEVKLAPGGIRDIEFAVQLLQLVHGRHDPSLRERGTLPALAALADGGYVGEDDAHAFAAAYRFLRTVEHRLQLRGLRRTSALPADPATRDRLARTLGYRDGPDAPAVDSFEAELRTVRAEVRRLHQQLFYRPLLGRFAEIGGTDLWPADTSGGMDAGLARERLSVLGFADAAAAVRHVDALAGGLGRRARVLRTLLPAMLPALAAAPDPDGGLAALRSLAERLDTAPGFLGALRDRPPVAELLATVLGRGPIVGRWLERAPEVLPLFADEAALAATRPDEEYGRMAEGIARRRHEPDAVEAVRRLARREVARTAIRDLAGHTTRVDVALELTRLAEACLHATAAIVVPPLISIAVIGMGKLGAREMGYASDLDVLFVFDPPEAREPALRAVERLIRALAGPSSEGLAYTVDAALRPEGTNGPLARTLSSYRAYYERWGEPWELQALTQARPVAGDRDLGQAFVQELSALVYPTDPPLERREAIRAVKRRMEAERPRPRGDRGVDVKLDPGGLTDVEWTVQLLQLEHGGRLPALRRQGTLRAMEACAAADLIGPGDAAALRDGWTLLHRVRHALYFSGQRDTTALPSDAPARARVARLLTALHPDDPLSVDSLPAAVAQAMGRVREVTDRLFYDRPVAAP